MTAININSFWNNNLLEVLISMSCLLNSVNLHKNVSWLVSTTVDQWNTLFYYFADWCLYYELFYDPLLSLRVYTVPKTKKKFWYMKSTHFDLTWIFMLHEINVNKVQNTVENETFWHFYNKIVDDIGNNSRRYPMKIMQFSCKMFIFSAIIFQLWNSKKFI